MASRSQITFRSVLVGLALSCFLARPMDAQSFLRVPQDRDLQSALDRISDGGVIEISAGVYPAPDLGFRIQRPGRGFTVRAAQGAEVVIDGRGVHGLMRITDTSAGRPIDFEGLSFVNGFSDSPSVAGGITVSAAELVFRACRFEGNSAIGSSGGGAMRLTGGSEISFFGTEWIGNNSRLRGGAIELVDSEIHVHWSRFSSNRVNLTGHAGNASGGAIWALNSHVELHATRLENNQAAFSGGAIFGYGEWLADDSGASGEANTLVIRDSELVGNRSVPCCTEAMSFGGAIYAGDQTSVDIVGSLLQENRAGFGGAVQSQRALTRIRDSRFLGNVAESTATVAGAGGALYSTSLDFAGPSNDNGAINRRVDRLWVEHTLIQGRIDGIETVGNQGGCVLAEGDSNSLFGTGGMARDGDQAGNQGVLVLEDSALFDCDVEFHPSSNAAGGAVSLIFEDALLDRTLVLGSDALGSRSLAGGMVIFNGCDVRLQRSTIARSSCTFLGCGITMTGSTLNIDESLFMENEQSPGISEPMVEARGAAIATSATDDPDPERDRPAQGVVKDSLFLDQIGLPLIDIDQAPAPFNAMRYDGNTFRETTFADKVYKDTLIDLAGESVTELNRLVVPHPGSPSVDKSLIANQALSSTPRTGRLVATVSQPSGLSFSGSLSAPPMLAYTWTGGSGARLRAPSGETLQPADKIGVQEVTELGTWTLEIDGVPTATAEVGLGPCSETRLCLSDGRFELNVEWRDFNGNTGTAGVVPDRTDDSGLFYFFDPDNWELMVKVLDACDFNDRFWVFSAATTNVEYTLTVLDTFTGASKTYVNPLGVTAPALTDTDALGTCNAGRPFASSRRISRNE